MKKINIIFLTLLAFALTACDKDVNNENLSPNTVYIVNSGVNDVVMYSLGNDYVFQLGIYKSGALKSSASVELSLMTAEELDAYNTENETNFVAMPASCYTISGYEVSFTNAREDVGQSIEIVFKPGTISELPATAQTYVLPIKIAGASIDVNGNKSLCIVKPSIEEPAVKMTGFLTDSYTFAYPVATDIDRIISVELGVDNEWEIECTFEVDEAYVAVYNAENATSFSLLPADCYSFPTKTTISAPSSIASITLEVDEAEIPVGRFLLPIRLKSVSRFEVAQDASLYMLQLKVNAPEIDRAGWSVTSVSSVAGGYPGSYVIDDNPDTFWHTSWSTPVPQPPHEIVIDMGQEYSLVQVGLTQRADGAMIKEGEIYVSTDNVAWTKAGTFTMVKEDGATSVFELDEISEVQYFRVSITDSYANDKSVAVAEITAYGY